MMMVQPSTAQSLDQRDADFQLGLIEPGEPLVEQQHLRIGGERARQFDPLLVDIGQRRDRRRSAAFGRPTRCSRPWAWSSSSLPQRRACPNTPPAHDVLQRGHRRQHAHQLEGAGDAPGGDAARAGAGNRPRHKALISPEVGVSAPEIRFIIVVLPEPFGPIRPRTSFSASDERHAVDGDEAAEALADAGRGQRGGGGRGIKHCGCSSAAAVRTEATAASKPRCKCSRAPGGRWRGGASASSSEPVSAVRNDVDDQQEADAEQQRGLRWES